MSFQLKLGGEELPIQDYVQMTGEDCIEAEYSTSELVNIALDNSLSTPDDFDFNFDLGDVDDHPPPIVRLSDAQHYT